VTGTDRPTNTAAAEPVSPAARTQRVALEYRIHGEGADAEHVMAAHEQRRPVHRLAAGPKSLASPRTASPISHVRALPMAGQTAGSMQCVGQIQSANETYRVRSRPVRS